MIYLDFWFWYSVPVNYSYPLLPLLPLVTPVTPCYLCYPLLPLLPLVTFVPLVTPYYPLLPLLLLVTLVTLCYPLLPHTHDSHYEQLLFQRQTLLTDTWYRYGDKDGSFIRQPFSR